VSGVLLTLAALLICAATLPRFLGARRQRRNGLTRARAFRRELPDALELLAAAIDGGAPVERALAAVAGHVGVPLSTELRRAAEGTGETRPGAMLAREPALRALGALVSSSEELGVPLASALRGLAAQERDRRRREVRMRAAAAGPRMTLVVAGLLAPAALLLVVGAELLSVMQTIRGAP
jgi:tight adherence protein C